MKCEDRFRETYRQEPEGLSFCPYRVCPIGAHSDHQLGKITGFAIDRGIHIAYSPKQNGVRLFAQAERSHRIGLAPVSQARSMACTSRA